MPSKILNLDSSYSNYILNSKNTTGNTLNSFHTSFPLNERFSKINQIIFKSIELPITFANIRTGSTNSFNFLLNSVLYTIPITSTNYTSISTLIIDVNALLVKYLTLPTVIVLSLNSSNKLQFKISNLRPCTFSIVDNNFSNYILGFRSTNLLVDSVGETTYNVTMVNGISTTIIVTGFLSSTSYYYMTASSTYNLSPDNYISMHISNVNCASTLVNGKLCTFKIPISTLYSSILFYSDTSRYPQTIINKDKNLNVDNLVITLYDRWGFNLSSEGLDYTLSLIIDYDL